MAIYDWMRRNTNKIPEDIIIKNAVANFAEFNAKKQLYIPDNSLNGSSDELAYVENQAQWGNIRFGKESDMSRSGCGIIATYNALTALHEYVSLDVMVKLISSYEHDGAAFGGNFGVAPSAIYDYFRKNGFETAITGDNDVKVINNIGKNYDVVIVTAYNDEDDITDMVHTVCITKSENGGYVIHNAYNFINGKWIKRETNVQTLRDAITQIDGNSKAISVIGINSRKAGSKC